MSTQKWLCTACRFPLGFVEDKKALRIKRKDLYVTVEGGKVSVPCVRCGKLNILENDDGISNIINLKEGGEKNV